MAAKVSDPGLAAHLADYPDPGASDLPSGYTLDPQESSSGLPPGYTLDAPSPTRRTTGAKVLNEYRNAGQPITNVLRGLIQPFQEAGAFGAEAIRRSLGGQVRPEDRLPLPNTPPTVESETLQEPNMFLDPTNFLTGAGMGAATAARAGQPLASVAREALRTGVGFQTFGLSDLIPGLAGFGRGIVRGYREGPPPPPPPPPPPTEAELEAMAWAARTPEQRRGLLDMAPPEGTYQPSAPTTKAQVAGLKAKSAKEAAAFNAQRAAEAEAQRLNIERGGLVPSGSRTSPGAAQSMAALKTQMEVEAANQRMLRETGGLQPSGSRQWPQVPMTKEAAGRLLAEQRAAVEGRLPVPPGKMKAQPLQSPAVEPSAPPAQAGGAPIPELPLSPVGPTPLPTKAPLPIGVAPEVSNRMALLRTEVSDARTNLPTGKIFGTTEGETGMIQKHAIGAAKSIREQLAPLYPELSDLPNVGPKEIITAIDKDHNNPLYLQIQDAVARQLERERVTPSATEQRHIDFEAFSKAVDDLAAQQAAERGVIGSQPPLLRTQAEMPPTPLQGKVPQVEHGNLLEGFKPEAPKPPELPLGTGEPTQLHAGLPIPQSVKDWAKRSFPVRAGMEALKASLPADLRVLKEAPQSPVISLVDRLPNDIGSTIKKIVSQPWAKTLEKYSPEQMKDFESMEVRLWKQGGQTSSASTSALQSMPPAIQAMRQFRASRLPIEQWARQKLGLPEIDTVAGPYYARIAPRDLNDIVTIGRNSGVGLGNDLRTSIGGFAKSRVHDTMLNGEAAGTTYADPRSAWAAREWYSAALEATAKMVDKMEGTVLFRNKADAVARNPSGTPTRVEGIPGSETWWTPTKAEADFLQQNLTKQSYGPSASLSSLANQTLRNPNLFNPYPHFVKNMLFKFGLSGGNFTKFRSSMNELATQPTNPLVQRFKAAFPVEETSALPNEMLRPYLRPEPNLLEQGLNAAQKLNQYSREKIFTQMDPGLRYARWKQYVQKGMSDTEAANHVHIDLVRYGLRSSAKDFWQSIPLNFFTAWRTGTVMSLVKQATTHPVKAALFVGAVEYLREARYRQTGRWTHIPTDYVEAPVAQIVEKPTASTILPIIATTALFGPGGAVTASTLRDALDDVRGGGDWKRVQNMFWGLSQLYDIPKEWNAYRKTGDVSHLGNILTGAAIAEHSALNYEPRRFTKYLPESLPFMRKSPLVSDAEYMQQVKKTRSEQQQMRREARPRRTIEERLTNE